MGRDDWFRNTRWSRKAEARFFQRLSSVENKAECLRIQASLLAEREPAVALRLLDDYFAAGGDSFPSWAYVDRAIAYRNQANYEAAAETYEAALAHETEFSDSRAWLEYAELIAGARLRHLYPRAIDLLQNHEHEPAFPLEAYLWHGSLALIWAADGRAAEAEDHARLALLAATRERSDFRNHPKLGVVGATDDGFGRRLLDSRWLRNRTK